ncbi:AAA family ATPase [Arthrobacter koreensis]|uniref:AAA family ATPase n=1 Tax=Arthrobacter koreensis TaxID=199136 RepID=UPI003AEFE8BC
MSEQNPGDSASDFLLPWLAGLGQHAGSDTLLHFTVTPENSIDLTHAHPSGLAQLLAGRKTRLSTLLRDADHYSTAMRAARALRAKIYELGSDRGIDVGYLAAGTASWRYASDEALRPESLTAPVLLTAVSLTVHASQDDYELQLTGKAELNPALIRHLENQQGLDVEAESLARLAYGTARFDPHPVLERLRGLTEGVRGMNIEHRLLVSTFADLPDLAEDTALDPAHPVLRALMDAAVDGGAEVPEPADPGLPPLDDRAPASELLVMDADREQQDVLDLAGAGTSLVVSAPPGTGQTQTAVNSAAALVNAGKSVLVVAERRGTLNEFVSALDSLNLGSLVLQLGAGLSEDALRDRLIRAIVRSEKAAEPNLGNLHKVLQESRHQLRDHVKSLHNVRQRWGCSPYQAMQSLAELTSLTPAPATTVRLKRSVLDSITDRTELTGRLRRAAELGSFSRAAVSSPWFGAKLLNRKETEAAHKLTEELAEALPQLRTRVQEVAEHSQIRLGETFAQWGEQLQLLVAVRESLDKFTPDIFDRPVTDLISATASSSWRREHGVDMSSMTRSRLRRVAKEYIRPGVHIADLHTSLVQVQQQRGTWTRYATTQRHPSVPTGLADLNRTYLEVKGQLDELTRILAGTPDRPNLADQSLDDLEKKLSALAGDKETLETLPERTLLVDEMRGQGLGELLDDLEAREVTPRQVGYELELAWWQSALEAMISGDDYLAMSDGDSLRRLEAEYRLADNAHIASGSSRLRWELARRWREGIKSRPKDAARLREVIKTGPLTVDSLSGQSDELVSSLLPVWAASPLLLPMMLPGSRRFDALIILDAESMSLQAAVPAIARAEQVLAFGDGNLGGPRPFTINIQHPDTGTAEDELPSAFDALARILPVRNLSTVYRGTDKHLLKQLSDEFYGGRLSWVPRGDEVATGERPLTVEYLADGTGMPSADQEGVESVSAEVNRVVDLVFEHVRRRPSQSLAVITASPRHAVRVAEAIRVQMANFPWAADFFAPGAESFRVVPADRAAGLVRDAVIFSLGFGRTPHGRALHNFGLLSEPGGRGRFVNAMTRARHRLHVLTCFQPSDLDESRLGHGARDFYQLLVRELDGGPAQPTSERPAGNSIMADDPLVADLVGRLRSRGADVWDHYDDVIDIVATVRRSAEADPAVPMAIESDGTARYRGMSVRERSRLRPQLLERLGWRYMPLWTIEVFTDPAACADLVGRYLGLQAPAPDPEPIRDVSAAAAPATVVPHGSTRIRPRSEEQANPAIRAAAAAAAAAGGIDRQHEPGTEQPTESRNDESRRR